MAINLRRSAIAVAVSSAVSGFAFAGSLPSQVNSNNQVLFMSGSTAVNTPLEYLFRITADGGATGVNCAPGTISIYRNGASESAQGTFRTVICQGTGDLAPGQGTIPATGNNRIAFTKEGAAGSGNAFAPVNGTQNITFQDVRNMTCAGKDGNINTAPAGDGNLGGTGGNVPDSLPAAGTLLQADAYYNCTGTTAAQRSDAGIADVDSHMFDTTGQNEAPVSTVVFGVPVSLNLYRALQVAQGLNTGSCLTLAQRDTPACVPSLSSSIIAGLYSGIISDWTAVANGITTTTAGNGTPLRGVSGVTAPADDTVWICRRGNTSGTQRGTRAYFLNQGCGGQDTFVNATNSTCDAGKTPEVDGCTFPSTDTDNTIVFANSSTGNVQACLDSRDDQNRWAIGILGIDDSPNAIGGTGGGPRDTAGSGGSELDTKEYRFVRVDGALPSLEALGTGTYTFYTENVCTRASSVSATSDKGRLQARVCGTQGLTNPLTLTLVDTPLSTMPNGGGGILAKPDYVGATPNPQPVSLANMLSNPVNLTTKSVSGTVNNCSKAVALPIAGALTAPAGSGILP